MIVGFAPLCLGPTGPADPHFANVMLLLHGDGTNGSTSIIDSSQTSKSVVITGGVSISTAHNAYGSGSSIYFDGVNASNTNIISNDTVDWHWPDAFCVEFWIRPTAYKASGSWLLMQSDTGISYAPMRIDLTSTGAINIFGSSNNSTWLFSTGFASAAGAIPLNQWTYVTVADDGTTCRLFINGVLSDSRATWVRLNHPSPLRIGGGYASGDRETAGYINDMRITKGVARYTSDFTLPTVPHPDH